MAAAVGGFTINEAITAGKLPAEMVDSIWSRVEYESAILRVAGTTRSDYRQCNPHGHW